MEEKKRSCILKVVYGVQVYTVHLYTGVQCGVQRSPTVRYTAPLDHTEEEEEYLFRQ